MPDISVVIPSYNSAEYIDATLRSLGSQTFKNFEVIVVDDRSTDNTVEIATNAIHTYNLTGKIIVRPETIEKGVSSCRNLGIKNAASDWISFLDSDDLFIPETIQITTDKIKKYGQSCFAYFHGVRLFKNSTGETKSTDVFEYDSDLVDIFDQLCDLNNIHTSAITIKKNLLNDIGGFDKSLHGIEDYMMWLRVSKRTKWCYSKELLTDYRVRFMSLMSGRKLPYYVKQHVDFINSMRSHGEFNDAEIRRIIKYLDRLSQYYAILTLQIYGWSVFMEGIWILIRSGQFSLAYNLLHINLKNLLLRKIVKIIKYKKKLSILPTRQK